MLIYLRQGPKKRIIHRFIVSDTDSDISINLHKSQGACISENLNIDDTVQIDFHVWSVSIYAPVKVSCGCFLDSLAKIKDMYGHTSFMYTV